MKKILEVGCGNISTKKKDTTYLDITRFPNVDIVRDIEKGLPFADKTFTHIKAHHILEHIKDLIFVMDEFHRVLKDNGSLNIEIPCGQNAWIDPTHVRTFTDHGFDFFTVKDFNSINSGVRRFFKMIHIQKIGLSATDIRGINFLMLKGEQI